MDGVDLEIHHGEFFTMLGPSGSGKTTTLRLIAGFERPDSGSVELGGTDVSSLPPYLRDVNTVFQDYALFPHMNVLQNVAYGLRVKGVRNPTRDERAEEALPLVRLEGYGSRKPVQLSGGQRQRVALRAPSSTRPVCSCSTSRSARSTSSSAEQMQVELKADPAGHRHHLPVRHARPGRGADDERPDRCLQRGRGSSRCGTPEEIYERPRTEFVAGFVGVSNVLERRRAALHDSSREDRDGSAETAGEGETGTIEDVIYVGAFTRYIVDLDQGGADSHASEPRDHLGAGARGKAAASASSGGQSTRSQSRPEGSRRMRPKWRRVASLARARCLSERLRSSRPDAAAGAGKARRRQAVSNCRSRSGRVRAPST